MLTDFSVFIHSSPCSLLCSCKGCKNAEVTDGSHEENVVYEDGEESEDGEKSEDGEVIGYGDSDHNECDEDRNIFDIFENDEERTFLDVFREADEDLYD